MPDSQRSPTRDKRNRKATEEAIVSAFEAVLAGFAQAFFAIWHRSDFTRKPDLAEHQTTPIQRAVAIARQYRQDDGKVRAGLGYAHPSDRVDENILFVEGYASVTLQYRDQHRQAIRFQADADAPGLSAV